MNKKYMLVWVVLTRILAMLWTRYMLKNINTTTKSKYIRVSRLVSSRDKSHEQIYRLESWQYVYVFILFFILKDLTNLCDNFLLSRFCFKFFVDNIIKSSIA